MKKNIKNIGIVKKAPAKAGSKMTKIKRGNAKIAVLGWSSLIKNHRGLNIVGNFKEKGPQIPIEATRIAKSDGRLVLVIDSGHGTKNNVFYARSKHGNLEAAAKEFQKVERIGASRVGIIDIKNEMQSEVVGKHPEVAKTIYNWAKTQGFDSVIFSCLGRRFHDAIGQNFSVARGLDYLAGLSGNKQKKAVDSLNNIPKNIVTPLLTAFRKNKPKKH